MILGASFNGQNVNSSRIREKIIPEPGGKKAPDPDPQHWYNIGIFGCISKI
jgi:hypothetical protein